MNFLRLMLDMLTGAYNRRDVQNADHSRPMEMNTGRLFSLYAGGLDLVHEHAEKVLLWDNLDNAQGAVLDRYGANFGVDRQGTPDGFYRLLIKIKMIALLSGGDVNTVIQSTAALLDIPIGQVDLDEVFPAKVWVYVDQVLLTAAQIDFADVIARMLKRIVAAGVGFRLFLRTYNDFEQPLYLCTGASVEARITARPPAVNRREEAGLWLGSAVGMWAKITVRPVP